MECAWGGSLGIIFFEQGELSSAIIEYEAAIALARQLGDKRREVTFLGNLGGVYMQQGQLEEGLHHDVQALRAALDDT